MGGADNPLASERLENEVAKEADFSGHDGACCVDEEKRGATRNERGQHPEQTALLHIGVDDEVRHQANPSPCQQGG